MQEKMAQETNQMNIDYAALGVGADILNLSPHDIHLYPQKGDKILETFPKSGHVARALSAPTTQDDESSKYYGFSIVNAQRFVGVDVPYDKIKEEHGDVTALLVSMPVGEYLRKQLEEHGEVPQYDILGSDMSPEHAVRDSDGKPIGTRRLCMYAAAPQNRAKASTHIAKQLRSAQ